MSILSAENFFRKGLIALADGKCEQAAACFRTAMQIERQRGVNRPQMRYLSYFGLATALAHGATTEAIDSCETAARTDFFNPDLELNLGKVYALAGKITRAMSAFERGLRIAPLHPALRAEKTRLERRQRPPIRWLDRDHRFNFWLGHMRASLAWRTSR